MNNSPSFSAPSASPQVPSWAATDATHHHVGMSHPLLDHQYSAEHPNSVAFQPMFNPSFAFQPNVGASPLDAHVSVVAQPSMYATQGLNTFWKPTPNGQLVKMEPGTELFAPHDFPSYPSSHAMTSSMSLPNYATYTPDRRFNFSDAESLSSVASPTSTAGASSRPASAKRGAKRKTMIDTSLNLPNAVDGMEGADAAKASKKASKQAGQRRPPPSASHVTESGKPFPVIDTSAKHSSLFVPPDTTGLTKREARLVKNRAAAFLSRQRKREQFEEMEIKCKGISMLVWRMWEAIAGPDACLERIDSTPLAAVLANEDPASRLVLEEVITKKGASIAPTSDEFDGTPGPESQPEAVFRPAAAVPTADTHIEAATSAELERARSDLAASMQRESQLLAQVEALRASVATAQASMTANAMSITGFGGMQVSAAQVGLAAGMGIGSMPFKGDQGAELPLFVPESPLSKFTHGDASNSGMMLDASHSTGFDLSKTPTLAMFSENALRSRLAQPFDTDGGLAATGMGLGLDYRFPCASAPSSPSTASSSSSSMSSSRSRANSLIFNRRASSSGKTPSTLASVLLLAGMSLMGVGPSAQDLAAAEASSVSATVSSRKQARVGRGSTAGAKSVTRAAPSHTPGQPSSHLSDDDLLMEMGLDSASLSDAEDEGVDVNVSSNIASFQSSGAAAVSCI